MQQLTRDGGLAGTRGPIGVAAGALLLIPVGLYAGWLGSRGSLGKEVVALLLLAGAVLALSVSPNVFVALTLLVIGTDSLSEAHPLAFGGAQIYSLDVLLAIVVVRACLPRDRVPPIAALRDITRLLVALWAVLMVAEGFRAEIAGYPLVPIVRIATPVLYGIGFYVGLGRIIRERGFDLERAVRNLLVVSLGLLAYFAFTRFANTPFENATNPTVGHLGTVVTTGGVLRRDYGLASAFIVYPALALAGAAYLLHGGRRPFAAAIVAGIGVLATLLTLIRGEIFGLALGLALIVLVPAGLSATRTSRAPVVVATSFVLLIGGLGFWLSSPSTARGVAERSLPGLVPQTTAAEQNVKYRQQAVSAGFTAAGRHPLGVGLVPDEQLAQKSGVSIGFAAHSGIAWLGAYAGWAGLIAAALALLAVFRDSFVLERASRWLHPFLVGSLVMLVFYTLFDASGLLGQGWVTALAALIAALRFHAVRPVE